MLSDKNSVENLLHAYLLEEGILKDRIDSAKLDFGFIISFPLGPKSQYLSIYKPNNMNGIFITIRFQISKKKAEILNSLKDNNKLQFFILYFNLIYALDLVSFICCLLILLFFSGFFNFSITFSIVTSLVEYFSKR